MIPEGTLTGLAFEQRGAIAVVTIDRPAKRNAISQQMAQQLLILADEISLHEAIHVVVLRGAGDRAFCAGSDITELANEETPERLRVRSQRPRPYPTFGHRILQPVIAMIHGYCLGGGLELALNCDLRIASRDAVFGAPEITHGWFGGGSTSQLLPRLIGPARTLELLLTGEPIPAQTAYEWDLVNRVVDREQLETAVFELADTIASRPPLVAQTIKRAVRYSMNVALDVGDALEVDLSWLTFTGSDKTAGVRAFKQRGSRANDR